jgi:hypothetical protein
LNPSGQTVSEVKRVEIPSSRLSDPDDNRDLDLLDKELVELLATAVLGES